MGLVIAGLVVAFKRIGRQRAGDGQRVTADDNAFDLLDTLKTPAIKDARRGGQTVLSDAVTQLARVGETGELTARTDALVWDALQAGMAALLGTNFWMAERQLSLIVDAVLVPLARTAGAQVALPWSPVERETFACELATSGATYLSVSDATRAVDYLLAQYRAVADAYAHLRVWFFDQRATAGELARPYDAWLQSVHTLAVRLTTDSVLSWRRLSIVLPAYNEEEVIGETVEACFQAARAYCPNVEVLIVDDGSRDRTGAIVDDLARRNAGVVALHNRPNRGYGGALRSGFDAARGDLVFFMDSDGQFTVDEIRQLLDEESKLPGAAVLGYRAKRSDPFMRKLNAAGWKRAARVVVGLRGIRDIDCAFKLLPAVALRRCAIRAEGASINVELLAKLRRQGVPIIQLPVSHHPRTKGSPTGANWRVIVRAFRELFRLRRHLSAWTPPTAQDVTTPSAPLPQVSPAPVK